MAFLCRATPRWMAGFFAPSPPPTGALPRSGAVDEPFASRLQKSSHPHWPLDWNCALTSRPALARKLGRGDAVVIGLGSMIGAGIFASFAPAAAAAGAGLRTCPTV